MYFLHTYVEHSRFTFNSIEYFSIICHTDVAVMFILMSSYISRLYVDSSA